MSKFVGVESSWTYWVALVVIDRGEEGEFWWWEIIYEVGATINESAAWRSVYARKSE